MTEFLSKKRSIRETFFSLRSSIVMLRQYLRKIETKEEVGESFESNWSCEKSRRTRPDRDAD
jgi:hypothetical protein